MKYKLSDFNQNNGEELVFIRAFMAAGNPRNDDKDGIDVEFKINGSDVNFKEFVKLFVKQYDIETKVEATKILIEKCRMDEINEFNEKIHRMQKELSDMLAEKISSVLNLDIEKVEKIMGNY